MSRKNKPRLEPRELRTYGLSLRLILRGRPGTARNLLGPIADWAESVGFADALVRLAQTERLCGGMENAMSALARAERLADLDGQDRCEILLERLECALASGKTEEAKRGAERLIRETEDPSLSPRFQVRLRSRCASALRQLGAHAQSRTVLAAALRVSKSERLFLEPFVLDAFYR